ncbi:MAG: hypothetical protein ACUVS7_13670, partial [Bryobacteraceae bacterium]
FQTARAAVGINHCTSITRRFTTASKPEPQLHSSGGANLSASTPEAVSAAFPAHVRARAVLAAAR